MIPLIKCFHEIFMLINAFFHVMSVNILAKTATAPVIDYLDMQVA